MPTVACLIAAFIRDLTARHHCPAPLIVGLQGPQGCGKTTSCNAAVATLWEEHKLRGITVSMDDFYLTRAAQVELVKRYPTNKYLQQRGYPGTHDIRLGLEVLERLHTINESLRQVAIPRYDKSLCGGEGDRLPQQEWLLAKPPLDFVILEGWCMGFTPLPSSDIADNDLKTINEFLGSYLKWYEYLDAFVQLCATDIHDTISWRIEAERTMRATGKSGMSDERIEAYIQRFLPAYSYYLPGLAQYGALAPRLVVTLGRNREVVNSSVNSNGGNQRLDA